jgi:DivIVA domain-containing protein
MISAAAAENHRFARVKRNGYDPNEVDAVIARLITDLHRAQTRIDELSRGRLVVNRTELPDGNPPEPPEIRHLVDALR